MRVRLGQAVGEWGFVPSAPGLQHPANTWPAAWLGSFRWKDGRWPGLVSIRASLVQELPPGSMLAVGLTEEETRVHLDGDLSLAALSGPSHCVVAGPPDRIEALKQELEARGVSCRRLRVTHAFHSHMLDPVLDEFGLAARIDKNPPSVPFVSSLTGTWIRSDEATSVEHWVQELRQPGRFSDGVLALVEEPSRLCIEVGSGHALSALVRGHSGVPPDRVVLSSCRHAHDPRPEENSS